MKYPFRFVILALFLLGVFAVWLFVSSEETEPLGHTEAIGLLSDIKTVPLEAEDEGKKNVELDRGFAPVASPAEIMEAPVPAPVPAHMADRFTPEEYAAWKAKRQEAFGGPPLQRTLEDIPVSDFRQDLLSLTEEGRTKALMSFNRLRIPIQDVHCLRIRNEDGALRHECGGHDRMAKGGNP